MGDRWGLLGPDLGAGDRRTQNRGPGEGQHQVSLGWASIQWDGEPPRGSCECTEPWRAGPVTRSGGRRALLEHRPGSGLSALRLPQQLCLYLPEHGAWRPAVSLCVLAAGVCTQVLPALGRVSVSTFIFLSYWLFPASLLLFFTPQAKLHWLLDAFRAPVLDPRNGMHLTVGGVSQLRWCHVKDRMMPVVTPPAAWAQVHL